MNIGHVADIAGAITSVSNLLINSAASDLTATAQQVIAPGTITVS